MMKKLFVMLSLVLCLGMYSCFNSTKTAEPVQEEVALVEENDTITADSLAIAADTLLVNEAEVEEVEAEQVME